jgi:FkbM family methyltransferase
MADSWEESPEYSKFEAKIIASLTVPRGNAVDLGAHSGHYTCLFAKHVGSTGRVLSVEPDPTNLTVVCRNIWAGGYKNTTIISCAVADTSCIRDLYLDGGDGGDNRLNLYEGESRSSLKVVCLPLDQLVGNMPVHLLKMDIQGMEVKALIGGENTFRINQDMVLLTEYSPYDLRMAGDGNGILIDKLIDLGFTVMAINDEMEKLLILEKGCKLICEPELERRVLNLLCLRGRCRGVPQWILDCIVKK